MLGTQKRLSYKSDILLLTALLVLSGAEWAHIDILSYRGGLSNSLSWGECMLLPLYELFKIGIVFFALVRITPYAKPRREGKKRVITASLSILVFAASWILSVTVRPPGAVIFLMGTEKWVRRNVDVDAIQTWLLSKEADPHLEKYYDFGNLPDDLPHFVTDFGPKYIVFSGYRSEEERSVTFEWGGFLGHWGFVVGLPATKAKQKGRIQRGGSIVEYRRPVKPGVYVYDAG